MVQSLTATAAATIPAPVIEHRILLIRGSRVLLDSDLAELYGVATKALNQAVKRNVERFPPDFMFRLTLEEGRHVEILRSQFVTLRSADGERQHGQFRKYAPNVFTEHGALMLSSVLSSARAAAVNIAVVRTFVRLREFLAGNAEIAKRLQELELRQNQQADDIHRVFDTIQLLINPPDEPMEKKRFGFPLGLTSTS